MNRTSQWLMAYSSAESYKGQRPVIPTYGQPCTVVDLFRANACVTTGHEGWNSCYTDIDSCVGLASLIEGEITSWHQIEAAETALQALMWHDRIDVIVPGFKVQQEEPYMAFYGRCAENRSSLCFDLFKPCAPYDVIFATEEVVTNKDGTIRISNSPQSPFIGQKVQTAYQKYLEETPQHSKVLSTIPMKMKVPAYFSSPPLERYFDNRGFFGQFYAAISSDYGKAIDQVPIIDESIKFPPLLAIILTRAQNRNKIPEAIHELRDEIEKVRHEMLTFSNMIKNGKDQATIEKYSKAIQSSFDSTFAASRYGGPDLIAPLIKLYSGIKNPFDTYLSLINDAYKLETPKQLATRTTTGKMFSKLLKTESVFHLAEKHFTQTEIGNLRASGK
jgi:hypothetical protein